MRPPLLLTGGPCVGKTATGRSLAAGRELCAYVDVEDVRRLIVAGRAAPWEGAEGQRQQRLGVLNACALARQFGDYGVEVVLADVLTPQTCEMYRAEIPGVVIVHLVIGFAEAVRRAGTGKRYLSAEEFRRLHEQDRRFPPAADFRLDVSALTAEAQLRQVEQIWTDA